MRKILIDLGSNTGQSVNHWKQYKCADFSNWEIHAFEPIQMPWKADYPNVTLHRKCAGINNKPVKLYVSTTNRKLGTSVFEGKKDNDLVATEYESEDISKFIIDNFFDCHIVLKMNLEGYEYQLIPHMMETGSFVMLSELYLAWHNHKVEISKEEHQKLYDRVHLEGSMMDKYAILPDPIKKGMNMFGSSEVIIYK